jgi:hypothetical protein
VKSKIPSIELDVNDKTLREITQEVFLYVWRYRDENTTNTAIELGLSLRTARNYTHGFRTAGIDKMKMLKPKRIQDFDFWHFKVKTLLLKKFDLVDAERILNTRFKKLQGLTPTEAVADGYGKFVYSYIQKVRSRLE